MAADLAEDAQRDLSDIGASLITVRTLGDLARRPLEQGVVFCTYNLLVVKNRLQELIDWCGGVDWDGCIVFDECHRGKDKSSQTANKMCKLQQSLPNARVMYVSASSASDTSELAYMERLGLWGQGTAFKNSADFVDQISTRGTAALELVAMHTKAQGTFLCRTLSYRGAEFQVPTLTAS